VAWGCEGKGQAAADQFFAELDPPPAQAPVPARPPRPVPEPAIMVPFGPCPTVPAGHGIPAAWLDPGSELEPAIVARASRLTAVSMDMTGGYAASVRQHAPQATIVIDNYHVVQLATKALDEVRREYWNELRHSGASLMLAQGTPLHVVSEVLGHASIAITKDVYGHLLEGDKRAAAESMSKALFGGC